MQQKLYNLCGLPFSGKTTLAKEMVKRFGFVRVDLDEIKFELFGKEITDDKIDSAGWDKVFAEMYTGIAKHLEEKHTVIVDTGNYTLAERNKLREIGNKYSADCITLFIEMDEQTARERMLQNRITPSRFDVSDRDFESTVQELEKPGFNEKTIIYSSGITLDTWFNENIKEEIFLRFKDASISQLNGFVAGPVSSPFIDAYPESYALVCRFDEYVTQKIGGVIENLKNTDPDQFYYTPDLLHLTLAGGLRTALDEQAVISVFREIMQNLKVNLRISGVGSSNIVTSVYAYPVGFSFHELREITRKNLNCPTDDYARLIPEFEYMGWINIVRFNQGIKQEFGDELHKLREFELGFVKPTKIELVKSRSKTLRDADIVLAF